MFNFMGNRKFKKRFNVNMLNKLLGTNNNRSKCKSNNIKNTRFTGNYNVVNNEELLQLVKQDVIIIDVRSKKEFMGIRLRNSINIPVDVIDKTIENVAENKKTKLLIYCLTGERTELAICKLNNMGYNDIYIWGNGGLNTLKAKELLEV